jgi:hypothetical protein
VCPQGYLGFESLPLRQSRQGVTSIRRNPFVVPRSPPRGLGILGGIPCECVSARASARERSQALVRDANGNLKDDGTNLYDYDYRNQLVRIRRKSDMAVIATYDYDGFCRRIAKSTSSGVTSFYWIGFELAMEYDASGLVSRRQRGAGFNEVVSAYQRDIADLDQDGSTTDYVPLTPLYDGAHDCIGVLDHAGALAESYMHAYDGTVAISNAAGSPLATSAVGWQQGYSCLYRDNESSLLYAVHRYYSTIRGRFDEIEPLNPWADPSACGNMSVWLGNTYRNATDPLGLTKKTKKECCGTKWAVIIADWGFNWFEEWVRGQFTTQLQSVHWVKRGMQQLGVGYFKEINFNGRDNKTNQVEMNKAYPLLDNCATDPCCTGVAFFGHGGWDNITKRWTGDLGFGANGVSGSWFLNKLDHGLDSCFMGMCGATDAGWGDAVHEGGTYEGGEGKYHQATEEHERVVRFVAGTTRQGR